MKDIVQILVATLTSGSAIALIAIGINIIFSTTRIVNFAQGGIVVAAGYAAFVFSDPKRFGLNVWLALGIVLVIGVFIGIFVQQWGISGLGGFSIAENPGWFVITVSMAVTVVFWVLFPVPLLALVGVVGILAGVVLGLVKPSPLGKFDPATNVGWIITTFALGFLFIPDVVSKAISRSSEKIPDLVGGDAFQILGVPITPNDVLVVVVAVAVMIGIELLLSKTMLGRAFNAVSQDRTTASLMGINTGQVVILSFAIAGALGALASVLIAPKQFVKLENSILLSFSALIAAVLGGLGSTKGAVAGAFLSALVLESMTVVVGAEYAQALLFVVVLIILRVKPAGLFGRVAVEKV